MWLLLSVLATAKPLEIDVPSGSYVMAYFNTPDDPELLTPVLKFSHHLKRFSGVDATLRIELKIGVEAPTLHLDRWMGGYERFPCKEELKLANNKGFVFDVDAELGKVVIHQGEKSTVLIQKFSDRSEMRDNELVVIISKDRELITRTVKVPASFLAWQWDFADTFEYLDIALKSRKN